MVVLCLVPLSIQVKILGRARARVHALTYYACAEGTSTEKRPWVSALRSEPVFRMGRLRDVLELRSQPFLLKSLSGLFVWAINPGDSWSHYTNGTVGRRTT